MSTTFANSIDSNPIYAARAENDKDGNRIDTTYAKLADIPSVPVTDVEVNGTSVVSGGVAAVTVPTATSDLTNDSGFITLSDVPAQVNADWNSSSGASEILNKPTIPSGTQLVPAATLADADKVLTVNAQGVPGWAAGGGGSTYTAGDGIDITNDEISAKIGDGLEIGTSLTPVTTSAHAIGNPNGVTVMAAPMQPEVVNAIETTGITYTVQNLLDNNNVSQAWTYSSVNGLKIYPAICALAYDGERKPYADTTTILVLSTTGMDVSGTSGSITAGTQFTYNLNDINTTLSTINWATIAANPYGHSLCVVWPVSGGLSSLVAPGDFTKDVLYDSGTITAMEEVTGTLKVSNPLPASTSSDANKVLKVNASGEPEWATGGGGSQVQADWTEADSSDPSYIQNKPVPKTLTAGANISISEGVGTLTISAAAGLPASTSADEGKCLVVDSNGDPEWGTGGKTYTGTDGVVVDNVNDTVGLEAPVDIVAGPGISIDNPDGNTMRITNAGLALVENEAVRCGTYKGDPMYEKLYTFTGTVNAAETTINWSITEKTGVGGVNRIWINPANSFVKYGTAGYIYLPSNWRLGAGRAGSVSVINSDTGSLTCRCVDTGATQLTFSIAIRYTVSAS